MGSLGILITVVSIAIALRRIGAANRRQRNLSRWLKDHRWS